MWEELQDQIFEFEKNDITYYYIRKHKANLIYIKKDKNGKDKFVGHIPCSKCGGAGQGGWRRDNGICYSCHGLGYSVVNLDTTKNKLTAKRRLQALKDKKVKQQEEEAIRCEQRRLEMIERNKRWTMKTYTDEFYIILDTLENSTYHKKEYIKSKGGQWSYGMGCWWIPASETVEADLKDFQLYKLPTKNLIKENGELDTFRVYEVVLAYLDELKEKRGK